VAGEKKGTLDEAGEKQEKGLIICRAHLVPPPLKPFMPNPSRHKWLKLEAKGTTLCH
jgi:hypothetical protein